MAERIDGSPEKRVWAALLLVVVGIALLLVGVTWPRLTWLTATIPANWVDFARGFAIGAGIGLEAGGVVLAVAAAKKRQQNL